MTSSRCSTVAHVDLHVEAVLAGHAVALDDLGRGLRDLGDLRDLARRGAHADDRGEREAERARVHVGAVAGDRAVALEPGQALGDGGRGEADAAAQLGLADPGVLLQL